MRGNFTNHPNRNPRVTRRCACGQEFQTTQQRLDSGRGKFCSKACQYANASRPSGLKYEVTADNPAWFRRGQPRPQGSESPSWRGELVGYKGLHRWVARNKDKPDSCESCGSTGVALDWANVSHEYRRDLDDWAALCRTCHRRHDSGAARGAATAKYGRKAVQRG